MKTVSPGRSRVILLIVLLAILDPFFVAASPRILVLLSYHPTFPTAADVLASLSENFPPDEYELFIHFLNTKRVPGSEHLAPFREEIRQELEHAGKPDIVITCDDNALRFAVDNRQSLFPGVDVVFAGVNDFDYALRLTEETGFTGVIEDISATETISLMRKLFPKMRSLDIVNDGTETSRADTKKIRESGLSIPVNEINISTMGEAEFVRRLKERSPSEPLLLISAYSGKDRIYSFWQSLALIRKSTPSPVFHLWKHGIGNGLIGGIVVSHYEQINAASKLAKRVLAGERAETIPLVETSPNVPIFDYRELKRFGIAENRLPENSRIIDRPIGLRESDPTEFWLIIVLGTGLAGVSAALALILRYRAKASLQLSKTVAFLGNLINAVETPIYLKDADNRYTMVNTSFAKLSNRDPAWIVGKKTRDILDEKTASMMEDMDRKVFGGDGTQTAEVSVGTAEKKIFRTTKIPLEDMNGTRLSLGSMQDITADRLLTERLRTENERLDALVAERTCELERANRELVTLTETDQLTGLANRRKLDETLDEETRMAKRYGQPFSAIMIDLDHFKEVNDELGHQTGDAVLMKVARILTRNCRATDVPGRWGGEEFLVICKGCEKSGAAELAEKLRVIIAKETILEGRNVTASFGVAQWRTDEDEDNLIRRADRRLYEAKRLGRNRVVGE